MLEVNRIAKLYNTSEFTVINKIDSSRGESDKRHTFLLKFADNQELAVKVCRNVFTNHERIYGWQKLCKKYLSLGICCPQIIKSIKGKYSEVIVIENEEYYVYAEEMKRYKTYDEHNPKLDYEIIKNSVIESVGVVAANCSELLPWVSPYCVYDTFDEEDEVDENYKNAENFCKTIKKQFQQYSEYADEIWELFSYKRKMFEPVYRMLPKASFQSDLNPTNILIDDNMNFAGLIDFNLSGTEAVLCYIILCEVCGYRLEAGDLEDLTEPKFQKKCDDYLYSNLEIIRKHYRFSEYEKENFCLCYNTVYPFSA